MKTGTILFCALLGFEACGLHINDTHCSSEELYLNDPFYVGIRTFCLELDVLAAGEALTTVY